MKELALYEGHKAFFRQRAVLAEIKAAVASHPQLSEQAIVRAALTTMRQNETLLRCEQASLFGAILEACQLGLEPDNRSGQAYLVPYYSKKIGRHVCQLIIGYRGFVSLGYASQEVACWHVPHVVYEADEFDEELGDVDRIIHRPARDRTNRGDMIAVYDRVTMKSGAVNKVVVWADEIEATKKRSPALRGDRPSGPWVTDESAMWQKTAVRRLAKFIPQATLLQRAVTVDELGDAGLPQPFPAIEAQVRPALSATGTATEQLTGQLEKRNGETTSKEESHEENEATGEGPAGS